MLLRAPLSAPKYKITEGQVNASTTHCRISAGLI
jgi:hypothetical protein